MIDDIKNTMEVPMRGFSATSMDILSPSRSVITDMIMVQFISMIVTCLLVLAFKGGSLDSGQVTALLIGVFASFIFISALYSRITQ